MPLVARSHSVAFVSRRNSKHDISPPSRDVITPRPRWQASTSNPRLNGLQIPLARTASPNPPGNALREFLAKDAELEAKSAALIQSLSAYNLDRLPLTGARSLFKNAGIDQLRVRTDALPPQKGGNDDELRQWLWVLSAETADVGVERLLADGRPTPPFVLNMLVARGRIFKDVGRFVDLLFYIERHHIKSSKISDTHPTTCLSWMEFLALFRRLVSQCLASFPLALPSVANLAVTFIKHMPETIGGSPATAHAAKCELFNRVLEAFGQSAARNPFQAMEYNWSAQKILLNLSSKSQPPFHVSRTGYRAIRRVLAALPKSSSEKEVAKRVSKTWPPYRQDFDGRDEQRQPEDDMSRLAKAGVLQREAGYPQDHFDRAMDTLAGSLPGKAPTIQTRSLSPPIWTGRQANSNIGSEWAARVKATRNAREAWREFCSPPSPEVRPWASVYAEMFRKLFAPEIGRLPHSLLPGDVKESFPVHNGNLSAVEIVRLTPPAPLALYEMMLFSGTRPTGECLVVLIAEAPSKKIALRFIEDSPYKDVVPILRDKGHSDPRLAEALVQLPWRLFNAWIKMLCRTHARASHKQKDFLTGASDHIEDAIELTSLYYKRGVAGYGPERAAWVFILDALAGDKVLYSKDNKAASNIPLTTHSFIQVWQRVVKQQGLDDQLFILLCLMVRKTLRLGTFKGTMDLQLHPRDDIFLRAMAEPLLYAYAGLKAGFPMLSKPIRGYGDPADHENQLMTAHLVAPRLIFVYMQALAVVGDGPSMVRLVDWILDAWDKDYLLRRARDPWDLDYDYLMRSLAYFSQAGQRLVEPTVMVKLQERLETMQREKNCSWFWPDASTRPDAEVEADLQVARRWARLRRRLLEADGISPGAGERSTERHVGESEPGAL
ncbi:hypothetical protein OQA88_9853 [Cercophora sp. LCS_1]